METETEVRPENLGDTLHVQGFDDLETRHMFDPADEAFRRLVDPERTT